MSSQDTALQHIQQFRNYPAGIRGRAWSYVDRYQLADGMHDRVLHPHHVNQGSFGTCGPTAIVHDLIEDAPAAYVDLTTSLYWLGWGTIRHGAHSGTRLTASYDLRTYRYPGGINSADWVLTSTLRDSINLHHARDVFAANRVNGTTFKQQAQLLDEMGYQHIHYKGQFGVPSSRSILLEINNYIKNHYHVILGIDASILMDGKQDDEPTGTYNHWVDLLSPLHLDHASPGAGHHHGGHQTHHTRHGHQPSHHEDGSARFSVFSWGNAMNIPLHGNKPLHLPLCYKKVFGYLAAKY